MNPTHDGGHFNQGGFAPALKLFILLAGVVFAAGCSSLQPGGDGIVARDVLEIKHLVESHKDEEASSGRKVEYRLDSLDEKLQSRTEMLKTNVADLDKIIRDQAKEIEKLRRQVEELGYQLSAVAGKLGVAGPQPAAGAPPAEAAPPAGGTAPAEGASGPKPSVEDQFMEALKQFNLGRYELARKGFESVLASGAAGEQALQARYWLAETCFNVGDLNAASDNYKNLITENRSHALAWRSLERLAEISQKQGRAPDAIKIYEMIVSKNPNYEGIDRVKEQLQKLQAAQPAPGPAPDASSPGNEPVQPQTPGSN